MNGVQWALSGERTFSFVWLILAGFSSSWLHFAEQDGVDMGYPGADELRISEISEGYLSLNRDYFH